MNQELLASVLRECASIVERNETSPLLFKAIESLHAYAEQRSASASNNNNSSNRNGYHNNSTTTTTTIKNGHTMNGRNKNRPAFQRPINKLSNLIANGWLEQQRTTSNTRIVWKQILASLVEARNSDEETTLWIQREVESKQNNNGHSNRSPPTLDSLHQIPMKWLLNVRYCDDFGDFRFCLKIYNVKEEFVFRTFDEESCMEWVATLSSAMEASRVKHKKLKEMEKQNEQKQQKQQGKEASFPDLLSSDHHQQPTRSGNIGSNSNHNSIGSGSGHNNDDIFPDIDITVQPTQTKSSTTSAPSTSASVSKKLSLKELIAIAHGAGYNNTRGMERADLEKIAEHFAPASASAHHQSQKQQQSSNGHTTTSKPQHPTSTTPPPPPQQPPPSSTAAKVANDEERLKQQLEAMKLRQEQERLRQEQERRKLNIKLQKEEQERKERHNKLQQEFQREREKSQQQQQQAFPQQQQQQPNQHHHSQQQPPPPPPPPPSSRPKPMDTKSNGFNSSSRTTDPTSPMNQKYQKQMSSTSIIKDEDEQMAISNIKRNILITWALIPPQYNTLKPIDQLLTTIQGVFPPFGSVQPHAYFNKWKVITRDALFQNGHNNANIMNSRNVPDETKLRKAHLKLKVFLHPDRLPKDFDGKQHFVCKMLWDVTNDAYEEFMKNKDDLDWINK